MQYRELLTKVTHPTSEDLLSFGKVAPIGFPILGFVFSGFLANPPVFYIFVGVGIACFIAFLLKFELALQVPYRLLMVVALIVAPIVSFVLLALIFFLMITPLALWFRMRGRDSMRRKLEPAAATYWDVRTERREPSSYFRLY